MFRPNRNRLALRALFALMILSLGLLGGCSLFQPQGGEESAAVTWVFHWQRVGGIAGFCDDVVIDAGGLATVTSCRSEPAIVVGETQLTAEEQAALDEWRDTYRPGTYEQSDPAVADAMTVTIELVAQGDQSPGEAEFQAMAQFAQAVLARAGR
jgi:hypothetical protein